MKEIKTMSDEELREHLQNLRLKRKSGYDRKPRQSSQRKSPSKFKGLDDKLAAQILDELKGRGKA